MSLPDNGLAWLVVLKVLLIDQRRLDEGNNSSSTVITDPIQITCLPVEVSYVILRSAS